MYTLLFAFFFFPTWPGDILIGHRGQLYGYGPEQTSYQRANR